MFNVGERDELNCCPFETIAVASLFLQSFILIFAIFTVDQLGDSSDSVVLSLVKGTPVTMLILRCFCCRRCASGWHSSWTVPASWAGFCSGLLPASCSCSSTTVLPSHPTAYTCCSSSPSEYGTALLFGTLKELCLSGSWPWCLHGAGLQDIQVSSTFIFFPLLPFLQKQYSFRHLIHY